MGYIQHSINSPTPAPLAPFYVRSIHHCPHGHVSRHDLHRISQTPATLLKAIVPVALPLRCCVLERSVLVRRAYQRPVAVIRRPAAARAAEFAEYVRKECFAGRARGRDVDDRVPEAHEGEYDACGVGVGDGDGVRVDERIDAVDGRGDPGDEEGNEEEGCHFRVSESRSVGFHGCPVFPLLLVFCTGVA